MSTYIATRQARHDLLTHNTWHREEVPRQTAAPRRPPRQGLTTPGWAPHGLAWRYHCTAPCDPPHPR
ncbi:hypothetical protein E2C01_048681 [Portunus trituberculatus]|uniref:Uncharacterized protein n=1 Tax=Portunus trituberculatus TaxID=210409 RepID=A0A5B7GB70_PORTR|nr:hypothetical protein [Portunus trituberculatus]